MCIFSKDKLHCIFLVSGDDKRYWIFTKNLAKHDNKFNPWYQSTCFYWGFFNVQWNRTFWKHRFRNHYLYRRYSQCRSFIIFVYLNSSVPFFHRTVNRMPKNATKCSLTYFQEVLQLDQTNNLFIVIMVKVIFNIFHVDCFWSI